VIGRHAGRAAGVKQMRERLQPERSRIARNCIAARTARAWPVARSRSGSDHHTPPFHPHQQGRRSIMSARPTLLCACFALALAATPAANAADVQKERTEVRNMCQAALDTLYKEKPELKAHVAKSAGYGCFSSFGFTFILGGAGGKGLVHDNASGKDVFMNMGQASAGADVGIKDYREVLVFKNKATLQKFVDSGWEFGAGGGGAAKVKGKGVAGEGAASASDDIEIYPMTRTGLAIGGSAAGRKYWKSKELN
jgi:lipid-binding SYLF domain-containing protein